METVHGLPAFAWTAPTLTPGTTPVRRVHLTELRAALDAVYDALGRTRPSYTDATVAAGATAIEAVHLTELRKAVAALARARTASQSSSAPLAEKPEVAQTGIARHSRDATEPPDRPASTNLRKTSDASKAGCSPTTEPNREG